MTTAGEQHTWICDNASAEFRVCIKLLEPTLSTLSDLCSYMHGVPRFCNWGAANAGGQRWNVKDAAVVPMRHC